MAGAGLAGAAGAALGLDEVTVLALGLDSAEDFFWEVAAVLALAGGSSSVLAGTLASDLAFSALA